jgi:hypothetical protein
VPAAGRKAGEQRVGGGVLVEVKGLWVELRRETLDLIRIHYMRRAGKALADMQVVKE